MQINVYCRGRNQQWRYAVWTNNTFTEQGSLSANNQAEALEEVCRIFIRSPDAWICGSMPGSKNMQLNNMQLKG